MFFKLHFLQKNQFFNPLFLVPIRSLSPQLRPFGPHTSTKMKVEYPPGWDQCCLIILINLTGCVPLDRDDMPILPRLRRWWMFNATSVDSSVNENRHVFIMNLAKFLNHCIRHDLDTRSHRLFGQ